MTIKKLSNSGKLAVLGLIVLLSACSGARTIETQDDSANYKAARALPPLQKDLDKIRQGRAAEPVPASSIEQSSSEESNMDAAPLAEHQPAETETISAVPIDADDQQAVSDAPPAEKAAIAPEAAPVTRINTSSDNTARLEIDAELAQAWEFLSKRLTESSITIHNRNRSAARISIGCGNLETAAEVKTSGGWSIFTRKSGAELEYCALQLEQKKGATQVKVLNRSALEVERAAAEDIFRQILAN